MTLIIVWEDDGYGNSYPSWIEEEKKEEEEEEEKEEKKNDKTVT